YFKIRIQSPFAEATLYHMTSNLVISKFRNITQGEKPSSKSALFNCRIIGKVINNQESHRISAFLPKSEKVSIYPNPTHFLNCHRYSHQRTQLWNPWTSSNINLQILVENSPSKYQSISLNSSLKIHLKFSIQKQSIAMSEISKIKVIYPYSIYLFRI